MGEDSVGLQEWLDALSDQLDNGYRIDEESMHILLDLARDAAHEITRPAAPLTAFLVGVSVGRGESLGAAAAKATELAQSMGEPGDD
ncbi:DUF6457 domain-containing protein [Enemella evansiae]|uniref:Molybdopterin-guanine dinucleotide biosynthesis protein n=1 Tax=Enemella evansiae TaxID=2016499 RepID=A0A255GFF4_9ACTN|nr:DUF6457 domain-containing protein [Enemella evansiae]PFG67779.1 hypothetical protein B0O41_2600 [Propionibacteriaceae bacterium ES.041]OYN92960.1 molybdopterin-guanine dinucleotide biosynthesis protein [Enemella evansiae]OYN94702.1 molybdopterin-guanine dinucleotide biosynthesis protein [Enemella evansiae]OYO04203.1 molybdopterin-guanine dinucleotide biosynthesis protein [Enemella evansiae]OYO07027.1 molybdopterin-guanine dinucleotide biosynthesis protein [Enemella evansiae]